MHCPACQQQNPSDSRFCLECGGTLVPSCPRCEAELPPGAKFCNRCGIRVAAASPRAEPPDPRAYTPKHLAEKILSSRAALEGERKQVTVLFADVKGSMDLAERLDPEEWHAIMDRFFAILAEGVHRFEGTVNQYTGDGIMALFGAPIAHEDHAQRACHAALHLGRELRRHADELRVARGLNFAVRLGLNSGEVVVGKIGDDLRMDYTAQGHTVGLAARMEQIAAPDRAYLTEHTAKLVSGYFTLRDLGPTRVKGVAEPLGVYELEGAGPLKTRLEVSRRRGFSRFVGRTTEMATLEAALERALAGRGQVVGVVAEPGVGKSRLCHEFLEGCRARGLITYEAHGVAHGKAIPFLAILELFRSFFGITDRDRPDAAREKIAGRLLLLDESFRAELPMVFGFLGVPDLERPAPPPNPEDGQRRMFGLVKRVLEARGQREATVTLLDDLHWFDAASDAFLEPIVDTLAATRGLLLVNFRPEYRAGWMQKSYYQQLPLAPLGPEATRELLADLVGTDPSLAELGARICERTAGNPFFVEEIVQRLVEMGSVEGTRGAYRLARPVDSSVIPATVQAVLAARIDRLGDRERDLLQTAAVIGREVPETTLARAAGLSAPDLAGTLRSLVDAEFLYEQVTRPEPAYVFKHPLTQEVAYRSQLRERRARVHAAVARAIVDGHPDQLGEQAALVAHHWDAAGEGLEAVRWHRRAAEWVGANDPAEALRHWRRIREIAPSLGETPETIAMRIAAVVQILMQGMRLGLGEEEENALFAEGRELAERSGDRRLVVDLLGTYAARQVFSGAVGASLAAAEEALQLADEVGDTARRIIARQWSSIARAASGDCTGALGCFDEMLSLGREDPRLGVEFLGYSPYGWALAGRAMALAFLGRLREAETDGDRALELGRDRGEVHVVHMARISLARLRLQTGEHDAMLSHARDAVDIAERVASQSLRAQAYAALGVAHVARGEWGEGAAALELALRIAHEHRTMLFVEAGLLGSLAEARLGRGDGERARETAEEAIAAGRRRGTKLYEIIGHLALARVLVATRGAEARSAVEAALAAAVGLIGQTGAGGLAPDVHLVHAELARVLGDGATRTRELAAARELLVEMGAPLRAEQVARELGA
jgi:class 3 adenylate cyclase/tetratricopeptide (TPR) repeat protein